MNKKEKQKRYIPQIVGCAFFFSCLIIFNIILLTFSLLMRRLTYVGFIGGLVLLATSAYWVAFAGHLFIEAIGGNKK